MRSLLLLPALALILVASSASAQAPPDSRPLVDPSARLERIPCPQIARRISGEPGTSISFVCPANCARQPVWGGGPYADDSSICGAAIHAGVTAIAIGGPVEVHFLPGQASYTGTERNGVRAQDWGPWKRSFVITLPGHALRFDEEGNWLPEDAAAEAAASPSVARTGPEATRALSAANGVPQGEIIAPQGDGTTGRKRGRRRNAKKDDETVDTPYEENQIQGFGSPNSLSWQEEVPGQIHCERRGQEMEGAEGTVHTVLCPGGCGTPSVWGTGIYADDSSVCAAAIHAGVIDIGEGGLVQVIIGGAASGFAGSTRNGITSARWRAWPRSFTVSSPGQKTP